MSDARPHRCLLLAEADELTRMTLYSAFAEEYELKQASNMEQLTELLSHETVGVDLLILDSRLPGCEALSLLSDRRLCTIPVVILADEQDAAREQEFLENGARDFFCKPINRRVLHQRVNTLMAVADTAVQRQTHRRTAAEDFEQQRYRLVVDNSRTMVIEYDFHTGKTTVDPLVAECLSGDFSALVPGQADPLLRITCPPDMKLVVSFLNEVAHPDFTAATIEARLMTMAEKYEWHRLTATMLCSEDEQERRLVLTIHNVHNETVFRRKLDFLAECDSLTRTLNRTAFLEETRRMLEEHPGVSFVMVHMDVERFRIINQLYGMAEGDRLLQYLADQLRAYIETVKWGTVCRLESDAFAVCLCCQQESPTAIDEYMQNALRLYPLDFRVHVSFGLYLIDNPTQPVDSMMDFALQAHKSVKGNYKITHAYYDRTMQRRDEDEQLVLNEMEKALEERQFVVLLQPKVDMVTGEIKGAEALVRWNHPTRGVIAPMSFIPVFERNGFIIPLDTYVLRETCRQMREWLDQGLRLVPVSINISRVDLYSPHLPGIIQEAVDSYQLPHSYIELELTETVFATDTTYLKSVTRELRHMGFRVLMDDFGGGYSPLNTLKDIELDGLKLDMSFFFRNIETVRGKNVLKYIIRMAKSIGLSVVAEGVETVAYSEILLSLGCRIGQGYMYGRPVVFDEFEQRYLNVR